MNTRILKIVLVAIGLTLASASVFAAKGEGDHAWGAGHGKGAAAYFEKHMAKLHGALTLSSAQEAGWLEFSNKVKPVNMDAPGHQAGHQNWEALSMPDRLDKILDSMKEREKQMAEHAAAVRAFYGTLTPDQKKIFDHQFQAYHQRHGYRSDHKHGAM